MTVLLILLFEFIHFKAECPEWHTAFQMRLQTLSYITALKEIVFSGASEIFFYIKHHFW